MFKNAYHLQMHFSILKINEKKCLCPPALPLPPLSIKLRVLHSYHIQCWPLKKAPKMFCISNEITLRLTKDIFSYTYANGSGTIEDGWFYWLVVRWETWCHHVPPIAAAHVRGRCSSSWEWFSPNELWRQHSSMGYQGNQYRGSCPLFWWLQILPRWKLGALLRETM